MKLISLKKVVSFQNNHIVVEDLAYNHPYKRIGDMLVVTGKDKETNYEYKVYYSLRGELKLVVLAKKSRSVMLISWKEEYDTEEVRKIKPNGDTFTIIRSYRSTLREEHKLVSKIFTLQISGKEDTQKFTLQGNFWKSGGNISPELRSSWLRK